MTLTLVFTILFVAPSAICNAAATKSKEIDTSILQNVFGSPQEGRQAAAVVPANMTLTDPDYWDASDVFRPSELNYDMFDWALTKRVAAFSTDNFLLSPLGLKLALAILTEAATGATQTELSSVLGFDQDRAKVRAKFSSIIGSLQTKSTQYILDLGSRIYIQNTAEPRQRFAAIAQGFYKTELKPTDFSNAKVAAKDINTWVSDITKGRIPELVSEEDVAGLVVLIINTLYFRGTWRHQFAPNATITQPFYITPSVQKPTQFMNLQNKFYYADSMKMDAKILRMSYLGNKFSMYIVVPNSLTGLPRVLENLSDLRQEIFYMKERTVEVTLPRFQFDYTSHLDGVLKDMGVRQAFEDTASFPGIARGQSLHQRLRVSKILQRAGIEVNELGSTAYSATEISLVNKFGVDNEAVQEVIANRPFLFYIEDEETRQLLFTGRFSDPSLVKTEFKLNKL